MRSTIRYFACVTVVVLVAGCDGGSNAASTSESAGNGSPGQTAADYELPYEISNDAGPVAFAALDANSLQSVKSLTGDTAIGDIGAGSPVLLTGTVGSGRPSSLHPTRLVYLDHGHLTARGLGTDIGIAAKQFSSESISEVCSSQLISLDLSKADQALLTYTTPGADGQCFNADDTTRAAFLSDAPTVAPRTLESGFSSVGLFYSSAGALQGLLAISNGNLVLESPSLVEKTVKTSVSEINCAVVGAGSILVAIPTASTGAAIYAVKADGTLSSALYTTGTNETLDACAGNGTQGFFATSIPATQVAGIAVQAGTAKILAIAVDGSGSVRTLASLGDSTSFAELQVESQQVIGVNANFTSASAGSNFKLMSVLAGGGSLTTLDSSSAYKSMAVSGTGGGHVYYQVADAQSSSHAKEVDAGGGNLIDNGASSEYVDFQPNTFELTGYPKYDDAPYGFMLTSYTPSSGGTLSGFSTSGKPGFLFSLPANSEVDIGGVGPKGLFGLTTNESSRSSGKQTDLYAYDLSKNVVTRVTSTAAFDESPVY